MDYTRNEIVYKYQLLDRIGGGNFGDVWKAKDISLDNDVAVKLLDKAQYSIDERLLEAQIGNRLQHDNVVNIKYADIITKNDTDVVIIAMPYYQNGSIVNNVNSLNFIELKKAIKCIIDVLRGLEYLHENGYYHCDIKPNNILVGDNGEFILSDYGITSYSPNNQAVIPRDVYLPHVAPETIQNNTYDYRTDIYQVGLTTFRLLNGIGNIKDQLNRDGLKFRTNVLTGKIVSDSLYQPFIPRSVRRIINKAIACNPKERYQTALDMRRDLEKLCFPGFCMADVNGNIIGVDNSYYYRYECRAINSNTFCLDTYKKNKKSGNVTRVRKYCLKNSSKKELQKNIQAFLLTIVCGK
jgi:serine/threonine protein kinase